MNVRKQMGRQLALESPADVDVIVPIPDSGVPAALGFAEQLNVPFRTWHHPQSLCGPHLY